MKIISIILIALSILLLLAGMSSATGAPQEAVVAGICCFMGIIARIAQAQAHHDASMKQKATDKQLIAPTPASSIINS